MQDLSVAELLNKLRSLLPFCSKDAWNDEACIENPGRDSAIIYTNPPVCLSDISLPGINVLPRWLLSVAYLLLVCYLFLGVALASDLFVDGITQIVSTMKKVRRKNQAGEWVVVEEPVWNWVVANITLMALGTSAPEVLLATVEALLYLGKPAGQLGPACIVGSAAYNFLVITAVCTYAVPTGQFKRVSELRVYLTTAAWSLFAYIWMLVVLSWWTPNIVTLTEALLTLLFFVLLVVSAWVIDTQPWKGRKVVPVAIKPGDAEDTAKERSMSADQARTLSGRRLNLSGRATTMAWNGPLPMPPPEDALSCSGSFKESPAKRPEGTGGGSPAAIARRQAAASQLRDLEARTRALKEPHLAQVCFRSSAYSCLESSSVARVTVVRTGGDMSVPVRVHYHTEDGDAIAGLDYKAIDGMATFAPGEQSKPLEITILDSNATEPDVSFWVVLRASSESRCPCVVTQERAKVTIVDDDDAGVLSFELPTLEAVFRPWQPWMEVVVARRGGQDGPVEVRYFTEDDTARAGEDYEATEGVLQFESGEKTQRIQVTLLPEPFMRKAAAGLDGLPRAPSTLATGPRSFRLRIVNPTGGARLGARSTMTVNLGTSQSEPLEAAVMARLQLLDAANSNASSGGLAPQPGNADASGVTASVNTHTRTMTRQRTLSRQRTASAPRNPEEFDLWVAYKEQFLNSFSVPAPEEGEEPPSLAAHWLHFFSIFFKVVLAVLVPPAEWRGGYPCFLASLVTVIGFVYVLEQAATMLGCVTGLSEFMVGISLVALGTSLPDTFASMISARNDANADAAVGNITGSNSVNVFLGLGLPWIISTCYQAVRGVPYEAPSGDLAFSVALFAIVFGIAFPVQCFRRYQGGELGGGAMGKAFYAGFFVLLWLLYLILSGLRSTGKLDL